MIGILTFFQCYNYGTFLQAYSLQKFLSENGLESEFINYRSRKSIENEYDSVLKADGKDFVLYMRILKKIVTFKLFHYKLKKTKHYYLREELSGLNYDSIIIGSDQIWCYSKEWGGVDTPFFSDKLNSKNIISYAASMGPDKYDQQHPRSILRLMKNFNNISVRDHNTYNFAVKASPRTPHLVLDPTLIYDFTKELKKIKQKPYALFYSDGLEPDKEVIEALLILCKEKKLRLISIGKKFEWCPINIISVSPFKWMSYMKNAEFIVTCMFHGLQFSIKFNKQFAMFLNTERENKCLDFLKRVDLCTRVVEKAEDLNALFATRIDYSPINEFLTKEKDKSISFLINNLTNRSDFL